MPFVRDPAPSESTRVLMWRTHDDGVRRTDKAVVVVGRGERANLGRARERTNACAAPLSVTHTIQADGGRMVPMAGTVQELRPKTPDSEKITINLGYVDLGQIDLLVQEGFYSNRTDFIRTAIRNQLD